MSTAISLNRRNYTKLGNNLSLDYLSAKYKNIKQILKPTQSYTLTSSDAANAPGIAFTVYGDVNYWWVVCLYNGILDPISGLEPGVVLQLPSLADINALLSSQDDLQLTNSTVTI